MKKFIALIIFTCFLTGCGVSYSEIKEAVSGINTKAIDAASALTIEVHELRATELQYNDKSFTINDLFKTTLRDVQWYYDEKAQNLIGYRYMERKWFICIKNFDDAKRMQLRKDGDVNVSLFFNHHKLDETKTMLQCDETQNYLIRCASSSLR